MKELQFNEVAESPLSDVAFGSWHFFEVDTEHDDVVFDRYFP